MYTFFSIRYTLFLFFFLLVFFFFFNFNTHTATLTSARENKSCAWRRGERVAWAQYLAGPWLQLQQQPYLALNMLANTNEAKWAKIFLKIRCNVAPSTAAGGAPLTGWLQCTRLFARQQLIKLFHVQFFICALSTSFVLLESLPQQRIEVLHCSVAFTARK